MTPQQKIDAIDKGLLALVALLDDPLLSPDRMPTGRHEAILREAAKRLKAENIYFRNLLALRRAFAAEIDPNQ